MYLRSTLEIVHWWLSWKSHFICIEVVLQHMESYTEFNALAQQLSSWLAFLYSDKLCFAWLLLPLLLTMPPCDDTTLEVAEHSNIKEFKGSLSDFNVAMKQKLLHSNHHFPPLWTCSALYIMGGLVCHSHKLLPHCTSFPLWQLRQIFHQVLPTMAKPTCFNLLMLSWTQGSYLRYCMVSSVILCLHM